MKTQNCEQCRNAELLKLGNALRSVLDWAPVPPDHLPTESQEAFVSDMVKARDVLDDVCFACSGEGVADHEDGGDATCSECGGSGKTSFL